jgi:hypothetical protein
VARENNVARQGVFLACINEKANNAFDSIDLHCNFSTLEEDRYAQME